MSIIKRFWQHAGWRGMALFASGIAWISYGLSIATDARYGVVRGISVLLDVLPIQAWGYGWMACGILCLIGSVRPAGKDLVAFVAAAVPAMLWAVAYGLGAFVGNDASTWTGVAPWLAHAFLILVIARVTRPETLIPVVKHDGADER